MDKKKLTYKDIPVEYPLCFNDECARKASCMHYQAGLLMPEDRHHGPAVYPTAWRNGECKCYREKRIIQKAWGFTNIYDNIPKWFRAEARNRVRLSFSGGNGPYYRVHNGENMITPEKQEEIMTIIAQFGSTDGIRFDHYVDAWDFG